MAALDDSLVADLSDADVILCHYWNNPFLARFLSLGRLPESRIVFWAHNSGLEEPHIIPDYVMNSGALILFSTPASVNAINVRSRAKLHPDYFYTLPSTRSLSGHLEVGLSRMAPENANRLLYVGTVSASKMHPDSGLIFSTLSKLGFHIDVVGGDQESKFGAEVSGLGGRVSVHGWVNGVVGFLEKNDIFVYPLRRGHYGTGEQVILEAMASGLPVVVFDNAAESAIVSHGETGFIAKTADEFIAYVIKIASDKELYALMSRQGIVRVKENFDSVLMAKTLLKKIGAQLSRPKVRIPCQVPNECVDIGLHLFHIHSFFGSSLESDFSLNSEDYANHLFQRFARDLDKPEKRGAWASQTKGSPFHYLNVFPESVGLRVLCGLIRARLNSHAGEITGP
jgi:glycosyltransferase involved in cell wall biosynthesis